MPLVVSDLYPLCTLDAMAILNYPLDALRSYAGSFTWQPFVSFSRSTVLGLFKRISVGQIVVIDSDGAVTICGAPEVKDGSPRTELRVLKEAFWVRVLLFADMVSHGLLLLSAWALARRGSCRLVAGRLTDEMT